MNIINSYFTLMENIIKSVELKNFLCHNHITVNFTKKITLIGGHNGSGKSAIMLAIGLGLGQKNLERGKLVNFINSNSDFCRIKITLNNYDDFHKEFFDEEIIIVKTLIKKKLNSKNEDLGKSQTESNISTQHDVNYYVKSILEIKNSKNKVWSTTNKDLRTILDFYSLQIDNPLNYLTQENAKKFLNITNPNALYKFFLKGTEIESMKLLHDEAQKSAKTMQEEIGSIKDELKKMDADLNMRNEKIRSLQEVEVYEKTLTDLDIELQYSRLDLMSLRIMEKENKKLQVENDEYCLLEGELIQKHNVLREKLFKQESEMMQQQKSKSEIKSKVCEKINKLNKQKREIENDIKNLNDEIDSLKTKIKDNERQNDKGDISNMYITMQQKKEEMLKQKQCKSGLEEEAKELQTLFSKEDERIRIANIQINQLRRMIEENKKLNSDNLSYFGDEMHKLISEVKKTKFKGQVIGPLATEISLKEKKWFRPVSIILKNILGNFIVFEKEDREIMHSILKKYRVRGCNILVPNNKSNELINYNRNRHYKTVLDVLDIKNNIITNQLIILLSLENIILIEDRQKAHEIIKSKPQHVDCAFTIMGDQIKMFGNSLSDFGKSGNEKHYFENTADKLTDLKSKLDSLTSQNLINPHKQGYIELKKKLSEVETYSNRLEREIKEIEIEYDAIVDTQKKITDDEIQNIKETYEMYKDQKNGLLEALKQIEGDLNENRSVLEKNTNDEKSETSDLYAQCKKVENELNRATTHKNKTKIQLQEKFDELTTLQNCLAAEKRKLLKLGPEPQNTRATQEIEAEINKLKAKIELSKKLIDETQIKNEIKNIVSEMEMRKVLLEKNESKILEIFLSAEKRIVKREEIKVLESERAKKDFAMYAALRDYEGCLTFDHENETLSINLKMKNNAKAGEKGTLSGGERSYASICLLLSLWPSVCCSLKILDEFDVFMDNLNRRCALEMIVEYFKKVKGQVILITPLDTDQFFNELCDVILLKPPREQAI